MGAANPPPRPPALAGDRLHGANDPRRGRVVAVAATAASAGSGGGGGSGGSGGGGGGGGPADQVRLEFK